MKGAYFNLKAVLQDGRIFEAWTFSGLNLYILQEISKVGTLVQ
jgi:hypothetical protein